MDDSIVQFNNIFCINDVFNEKRASVTSSIRHTTARSSSLRTNHDEDGVRPIQHPMWVHIPITVQRPRATAIHRIWRQRSPYRHLKALINVSPIPLYSIHDRIVKSDGNCRKCGEYYISKSKLKVYGGNMVIEAGFYSQPLTAFLIGKKLIDKEQILYKITTRKALKADTLKTSSYACSKKRRGNRKTPKQFV